MAVERKLGAVGPVPFTANGGTDGKVTVASTKGFKVKAQVVLSATGVDNLSVEVKAVLSKTQMIVGPRGSIDKIQNISAYTTAVNATISQPKQDRPQVPKDDQDRATYEQEPTLARRVILVDEQGEFYTTDNPLKVQLTDGSINIGTVNANINVQLTDKESAPGEEDYDIVRLGDGDDQLDILPDGSIPVTLAGVKTPTIVNVPMANAGTEYNTVLAVTVRRFHFKNRGLGKLQVSFVVNGSATNFFTLAPGAVYSEESIFPTAPITLYFRSTKPNEVVELITWE